MVLERLRNTVFPVQYCPSERLDFGTDPLSRSTLLLSASSMKLVCVSLSSSRSSGRGP